MPKATSRATISRQFWNDLKSHSYTDEQIAKVVAERVSALPVKGERRPVPYRRFWNGIELRAEYTIQHPEEGSPKGVEFIFTWEEPLA